MANEMLTFGFFIFILRPQDHFVFPILVYSYVVLSGVKKYYINVTLEEMKEQASK